MESDINNTLENNQQETGQHSIDGALIKCQTELSEWKDRCLRINAEFENYKKREVRERQQWERYAQQEVIKPLLSVIDNVERAFQQQENAPQEAKQWLQGVTLIEKEFQAFLDKIGVQKIQEMAHFDPELHEAVMQVPDSGKESGTIITVFEQGYRFKGTVLRPARVSVAV